MYAVLPSSRQKVNFIVLNFQLKFILLKIYNLKIILNFTQFDLKVLYFSVDMQEIKQKI